MVMPVEGKEDTVKIDLATDKLPQARPHGRRHARQRQPRQGRPFEPDFVNLAKTGKVPLMIGPTWFGEYVIKPTYEWPAGKLAAAAPLKWDDQSEPLTWSWGGGTYGGWKDTAHPAEVVDLVTWMATDVANQTEAVTLPAHRPSAEAWGKRLKDDAYYADPNVFDVEADAAKHSHPGYVSLRFSVCRRDRQGGRPGPQQRRHGRRRASRFAAGADQPRQAQRLQRRVIRGGRLRPWCGRPLVSGSTE